MYRETMFEKGKMFSLEQGDFQVNYRARRFPGKL